MAFERYWPAVAPRQFTSDGTTTGLIQISDTRGFKVKGRAILQSLTQPATEVEVKKVLSDTQMIVGKVGSPITDRSFNASIFTVVDGSFAFANEQEKVKVPQIDREHATYDQEPANAWRNVLVDQLGRYYETANPLPVRLSDGSINIGTVQAQVEVFLTHLDNFPNAGDIHDSIRIGDGDSEMAVNQDGSINVAIVQTGSDALGGLSWQYNEISGVPSGVETSVLSVAVPSGQKRIQKIEVSGDNVAEIRVKVNGSTVSKKRLWWGNFNATFDFEQFINGIKLLAGDTLTVTALHNRPDVGDFEATAWYL